MESKQTIIAGGRDFYNEKLFNKTMRNLPWIITHVLSGCAKGADSLGINYAVDNFLSVDKYPADWDRYGRGAGYIRNEEMAKNADALVAFWDGKSKGTKHMIDLALKYHLTVLVVPY